MTTDPKLLGKYTTPQVRVGSVVHCARRGDVRIVGLSSAPIPWPIGQTTPKGRARPLVLFGDLVEAIRREPAQAVAYHWGVTAQTVTAWRKALDVGQYTEGTSKLKSEGRASSRARFASSCNADIWL